MRFLLAALPSVLWLLADICEAKPLKDFEFGTRDAQDADIDTLNETLWRRVRVPGGTGSNAPPRVDQIFLFGPSNMAGSCSGRKDGLQDWLDDTRRVHDAVERLYAMVTKPSVSKLWETFFGIFMHINPVTHQFEVHPDSRDRWNIIGDHIARITKFLDGNGLQEPVVAGEVPRIFCSPDAGQLVGWDSILKDENGNEVERGTDPVTGEKLYVSLRQAYPGRVGQNAFWMSAFNGYWFTGGTGTSLCPEKGRQAATGRFDVPPLRGLNVKLAQINRGIIICPKAFEVPVGKPHGQPSLTEAVGGDSYPKGDGSTEEMLDYLVPRSMTLYHEIVHVTDYKRQPLDPDVYPLGHILKMIFSSDSRYKNAVPHNPETYVHFGLAAYVYLNPPQGKDTILYVGGKSATETAVWDEISRKRQQGP
ncbi:hypothetical protein M419DRAFT_4570 [Trichoderma reesei RUT C-30]|uniref:Uncharacterized protein n=1 Tax=Hypocrea jecorina (strain ATCC 56765 / BCRC 32924 / NRRL 11460 / Rut C-30) TaxID=1344414 RepID=A0A024SMP4_HYPJR|nr:hypothetical protein M419DRAFT_4570 [Trichoderma reesei RUT C-30]